MLTPKSSYLRLQVKQLKGWKSHSNAKYHVPMVQYIFGLTLSKR